MTRSRLRRSRSAGFTAAVCAALLTVAGCGGDEPISVSEKAANLDTITPGVLKVAIQPYAPYTDLQGDTIVGLDGDILHAVAEKLDLKVEPEVADFAGMLAGVQTRRVDITIGGVAWTAERQKQGLFTDPPYYSPPAMAVKAGGKFERVEDLEGLHLGTVEGYVWVKSIQAVPGAKLHAYPDGTGVFDDLGAERIDVGFLDPLLIIAGQKQRPDLGIETQYLTPPTEEQVKERPDYQYFQPYMTSFYLPKESPKLDEALSAEIRKMYESGAMTELIEKYGGDPEEFLKPAPGLAETRQGVDRPADWAPPTI